MKRKRFPRPLLVSPDGTDAGSGSELPALCREDPRVSTRPEETRVPPGACGTHSIVPTVSKLVLDKLSFLRKPHRMELRSGDREPEGETGQV